MSSNNPYIPGDTPEYRIQRERFYAMQERERAAENARAKASAWQETKEMWRKEDAAAKIAKTEAEKRQRERNDELLAQMQRLEGTPEQQAEHRRRLAEFDAAWNAQKQAQKEARQHHFHAHHPWPGY
jgi:hypothetical protein